MKALPVLSGAALAASVVAAIAVGSPDEPVSDGACRLELDAHGTFVVSDDTGECNLLYPAGRLMQCDLVPVEDINYQWSYRTTPTGVVTKGLRRGADIEFRCDTRKE